MRIDLIAIEKVSDYRNYQIEGDLINRYLLTYAIAEISCTQHDIVDEVELIEDAVFEEILIKQDYIHLSIAVLKDEWRAFDKVIQSRLTKLDKVHQSSSEHEFSGNLLLVEPLLIHIGTNLIELASQKLGPILKNIQQETAINIGMNIPTVIIRDNLAIEPNAYIIYVRDQPVGGGSIRPDMLLAINDNSEMTFLGGVEFLEPANEVKAYWVQPTLTDEEKLNANELGWNICPPETVLAAHFCKILSKHAGDIITYDMVVELIGNQHRVCPELVKKAVENPGLLTIFQVLKNLLTVGYIIRDLESILQLICCSQDKSPVILTSNVIAHLDGIDDSCDIESVAESTGSKIDHNIQSTGLDNDSQTNKTRPPENHSYPTG